MNYARADAAMPAFSSNNHARSRTLRCVTERPGSLPPEVTGRAEFADACSRRDLGTVFRIAIQWGTGVLSDVERSSGYFSDSDIARRCRMTVERVRGYINRDRIAVRDETYGQVADGLRIPGHMLGISPRAWEAGKAPESETVRAPSRYGKTGMNHARASIADREMTGTSK